MNQYTGKDGEDVYGDVVVDRLMSVATSIPVWRAVCVGWAADRSMVHP